MVGGGIFAVLGVVVEQTRGGAPVAFLLGGVVALLTASSYATLCVAYPSRGGSVVFVDRVFGRRLATGALNNLLWFGYLVTLSLYAVAFANYASALGSSGGGSSPWTLHALICTAILVPTAINLANAGVVARAETAIVAVKIAMLLLVVAAGTRSVQPERLSTSTWPSLPMIVAAAMLVFVAYEGFELIANAGEDIREPSRNLPRALYLAVGSVILLYIAVAVITVGSLDPHAIAASADFALAEAARPSLGQFGFTVVGLAAVLATLSAINATLYGTARLSYSIAIEGELPPAMERKVWTQPIGLLVTAGLSLLLANVLDVTQISSIASAVFLIVFGVVNVAAFRTASHHPWKRLAAGTGAVGCTIAFLVLGVDTAAHRPLALVVLVTMTALAFLGEAMWLSRRRTLRLRDTPST